MNLMQLDYEMQRSVVIETALESKNILGYIKYILYNYYI